MKITNKRALVLGGTSGIGFATAEKLAAAGAEVIACGSSETSIEVARASTGDSIAYRAIDVLDRDGLASLFSEFAPFDILVSTAAPRGRAQGPFPEMDLDFVNNQDSRPGRFAKIHKPPAVTLIR